MVPTIPYIPGQTPLVTPVYNPNYIPPTAVPGPNIIPSTQPLQQQAAAAVASVATPAPSFPAATPAPAAATPAPASTCATGQVKSLEGLCVQCPAGSSPNAAQDTCVVPVPVASVPMSYPSMPAPIVARAMYGAEESQVEVNGDGEVVEKDSKDSSSPATVIIASVAIIALLSAISVAFFYKNANLKNNQREVQRASHVSLNEDVENRGS